MLPYGKGNIEPEGTEKAMAPNRPVNSYSDYRSVGICPDSATSTDSFAQPHFKGFQPRVHCPHFSYIDLPTGIIVEGELLGHTPGRSGYSRSFLIFIAATARNRLTIADVNQATSEKL